MEIPAALRGLELTACGIELFLETLHCAQLFLLGTPARGELGRSALQIRNFLFNFCQTLLGGGIGLLLEGFPLNLELDHLPIHFVDLFRLRIDLHAKAARRLVDQIDSFVGQVAVRDVAVR